MGTAVTPQLVDVIDLFSAQRSHSSGSSIPLNRCQVEPWGLSVECPTPEDPVHEGEVSWLLPDHGLRLTRRRARHWTTRREPSTITAALIEHDTRSWVTTDLLLGLQVPDHGSARIVQAEEFATAISAGMIRLNQADYALRTVYRIFAELSRHRDVSRWLAHLGIFDLW